MSAEYMPQELNDRVQLLHGTLDMLILRTLVLRPAHGHQIRETYPENYGRLAAATGPCIRRYTGLNDEAIVNKYLP